MSSLASVPTPSLERWVRLLGRRTLVPNPTLADHAGVGATTIRRWLERWSKVDSAPSAPDMPATGERVDETRPAAAPVDRLAIGRAMERFNAGRIAAYEAAACAGSDDEPERTARTVGHYARVLGLVRAYMAEIEKDRDDAAEPPGRSLSELRDELRRHLERLWDASRAAGGDRGA